MHRVCEASGLTSSQVISVALLADLAEARGPAPQCAEARPRRGAPRADGGPRGGPEAGCAAARLAAVHGRRVLCVAAGAAAKLTAGRLAQQALGSKGPGMAHEDCEKNQDDSELSAQAISSGQQARDRAGAFGPLTRYFRDSYLSGAPYYGPEYTLCEEERSQRGMLTHDLSGIQIWAEALDLRSAASDSTFVVLYHYTSRDNFEHFADRGRAEAEICEGLSEPCGSHGRGIVASATEPGQFGSAAAVLQNFAGLSPRCGDDGAEFCIPMLVPWCFANEVSSKDARASAAHDAWVVQLSEDGMILLQDTSFEARIALARRRVAHCERTLGPTHARTLASLSNLALLLANVWKPDAMEGPQEEAQFASEAEDGRDQGEQAGLKSLTALSNHAFSLKKMGKLQEAEPLSRRALEAHEKMLGPVHPCTLTALSNRAVLLQATGKYKEAEPLCRRALEAREQVLGVSHPDTLTSLSNLAALMQTMGRTRLTEAETLCRRALKLKSASLGVSHAATLVSMSNLVAVLCELGSLEEAEPLCRRALEGHEEKAAAPGIARALRTNINLTGSVPEHGQVFDAMCNAHYF
ncbi:unnamed protein product [Prorocentrum cordatum]|nr:unnamed protein product [Polarella glacialis]